jgi:hypothetical protein
MSVFSASVQRTKLEIMSLLTCNTPSGITTYIERSAMPTQLKAMLNAHRKMCTMHSTSLHIISVSLATFESAISTIPCRFACLPRARCGWSTSWWRTTWLDQYNAIWLSVPANHNRVPNNTSYKEFSQRNGKDMKEMSLNFLGIATQSLRGRSPTQRP